MSTQDAMDIAFSAAHQQRPFKLLELPPELLQLLEAENPPTLYLKSSTPSAPTAASYAILCAPGRIYRVQQKNTSNPIMLLEPCIATSDSDEPASGIPKPGLRAISTIEDTLELYIQEVEAATFPTKVNKWHEKFAKSRAGGKATD